MFYYACQKNATKKLPRLTWASLTGPISEGVIYRYIYISVLFDASGTDVLVGQVVKYEITDRPDLAEPVV